MVQPGENAVMQLIQSRRATSQIELARALNLPANTVHGMIKRLLDEGLIVQSSLERKGRGRPMLHYAVKIDGPVLAIEWLGTIWNVGIFGEKNFCFSLNSPVISEISAALKQLTDIRDGLPEMTGLNAKELKGVVISFNGARSPVTGALTSSVIPWINDLSADAFKGIWSCPVLLTEIPSRAITEARARAREGCEKLCVFNVGDGVSAQGVTSVGPWGFPQPFYGEIGHVCVDKRGRLCGCGHRGCLETVIGGPHFIQRVRDDITNGIQTSLSAFLTASPAVFFDELAKLESKNKESYAVTLVDELLDQCAWAVSVIMNLFDPDVVVLSGYVVGGRESWKQRIREKARGLVLYGEGQVIPLDFPRLKLVDRLESLVSEFTMSGALRPPPREDDSNDTYAKTLS
jgi:predicted NBD/HSP70 family sugar kinase